MNQSQPKQPELLDTLKKLVSADANASEALVKSISKSLESRVTDWCGDASQAKRPFIIALGGPSGGGKSYIRDYLVKSISKYLPVTAFTQDNYYVDFEKDFPYLPLERFYDEIDLDDPAHIRFLDMVADLNALRSAPLGSEIAISRLIYGTPDSKPTIVSGDLRVPVTPVIVTEGIHAFYDEAVCALYDLTIYVDVSEDDRRERWLARNIRENRGTTDNMWQTTVDCLQQHILPTRDRADIVLNNTVSRAQMGAFIIQAVSMVMSSLKVFPDVVSLPMPESPVLPGKVGITI